MAAAAQVARPQAEPLPLLTDEAAVVPESFMEWITMVETMVMADKWAAALTMRRLPLAMTTWFQQLPPADKATFAAATAALKRDF
jgi:hypothetical protein